MARQDEFDRGHDGCCETVVIQGKHGPVTINKADFDEKKHKLYEEKKPEPPAGGHGVDPNKPAPRIAEATGSSAGKAKG